jgi:mevalonate kinase
MIKVAMDSGALAAKLAGAGGGGTIIVLTHEQERVMKALKAVGAEEFVTLDPKAGGVKVEYAQDEGECMDVAL